MDQRNISQDKGYPAILKNWSMKVFVEKTIDTKAMLIKMYWRAYPIYRIPAKRKQRIEEIRNKKQILEYLDSANPEEIKKLQEDIKD